MINKYMNKMRKFKTLKNPKRIFGAFNSYEYEGFRASLSE